MSKKMEKKNSKKKQENKKRTLKFFHYLNNRGQNAKKNTQ